MSYAEVAWIPMCIPKKGEPWFWPQGIRDTQKETRSNFVKHCHEEWPALRKDGWRIVRVKLTTEIH